MLSENLFCLKIDDFSYFSFQLEKDNARIDNDGQVTFHKGKISIECGTGPLEYEVDDMILYIKWILSSNPIELNMRDRVGEFFYQNCCNLEDNKKVSDYMFISGCDSIVWLYRIGEKEYCFEVTTGSHFCDPETAFQKIHGGLLNEEDLKWWLTELTSFRKLFKDHGAGEEE